MQFMPTTYLGYTSGELPTSSASATPTNNTIANPGALPYSHDHHHHHSQQQQQQQQQHQQAAAHGVPQQLPYPTPVGMPPLHYAPQQAPAAAAAVTQSAGGGPMVKPKRRQVKNACGNYTVACLS